MKLTLGRAQSLMIALTAVDRDEKCRLDGRTRIAIAIDINLLQPHVAAYEKVRAQKLREIMAEGVNPVKEAEFAAADAELRESEVELALKQFALGDLKLDDNPRITGAMIAMLAPALSDLAA
jgi:hypothetical protein